MKLRWDLISSYTVPAVIMTLCPVLVWLTLGHLGTPTIALVGVLAIIVAIYIGLWHPLWLYWGLAFTLAGVPFALVPGVHLPLYFVLEIGVLLAAIIYPRPEMRFHSLEIALFALVFAGGVSVVVTTLSIGGLSQYVRWSMFTLVAVALLRLSNDDSERFGRIFVWVSSANALWGILLVTVDRSQKSFAILKPFGYDIARVEESQRNGRDALIAYSYNSNGVSTIRLGSTWIGPNGASIAYLVAIVLCLMLFSGWRRNWMVSILSIALLLTLSRQSIFTLLIGLALVPVFHTMRSRDRWWALGSLALMVVAAVSVPYVRERLLSAFASSDYGGAARRASLGDFPGQMAGHWLFGLGWTRPEVTNSAAAYELNLVSNAPLLHVYRSGIVTVLAFIAVCLIGCVIAYRALRSDSFPFAVCGGVFIAFCLVAMQLDHSVADVPQTSLCFSILLAFLGYIDRSRRDTPLRSAPANKLVLQS